MGPACIRRFSKYPKIPSSLLFDMNKNGEISISNNQKPVDVYTGAAYIIVQYTVSWTKAGKRQPPEFIHRTLEAIPVLVTPARCLVSGPLHCHPVFVISNKHFRNTANQRQCLMLQCNDTIKAYMKRVQYSATFRNTYSNGREMRKWAKWKKGLKKVLAQKKLEIAKKWNL